MKIILAAALIGMAACELQADEAGLQISLIPDVALQNPETTIHGLSINLICGRNPQQGITLGFYNIISDNSAGFAWGAINYADSYQGVNWGWVNWTQENFRGWQDGWINYTGKDFCGLQSGLINIAGHSRGLQFGVLNYSHELQGMQIGVMNIAAETHWFQRFPREFAAAVPFVNWTF